MHRTVSELDVTMSLDEFFRWQAFDDWRAEKMEEAREDAADSIGH